MITNLEICDKDCEVKRYMYSDTNTYMTICNNCIHSKKWIITLQKSLWINFIKKHHLMVNVYLR